VGHRRSRLGGGGDDDDDERSVVPNSSSPRTWIGAVDTSARIATRSTAHPRGRIAMLAVRVGSGHELWLWSNRLRL